MATLDAVAAAATRCLRLPSGCVGPDVPLARLGLDSLGCVEFAAELETVLGVQLPADAVVEYATIRSLCAALSRGGAPASATRRRLLGLGLVAIAAFGLPLIVAWSALDWRDRDYDRVRSLVRESVTEHDRVLTDYAAYYEVKTRAAELFFVERIGNLTANEKEAMDVVIVEPSALEDVAASLGGRWQAVGSPLASRRGPDYGWSLWGLRYQLRAYRRR